MHQLRQSPLRTAAVQSLRSLRHENLTKTETDSQSNEIKTKAERNQEMQLVDPPPDLHAKEIDFQHLDTQTAEDNTRR